MRPGFVAVFVGLMIAGSAVAEVSTTGGIVAESGMTRGRVTLRLDDTQLHFELRAANRADMRAAIADLAESHETNRSVTVHYDPDSGVFDPRTFVLTYQVRELLYRDDKFTGVIKPPRPVDPADRRAVAERDLAHGAALRSANDPIGARRDIEAALDSGALPPPLEALAIRNRGGLAGRAALFASPGDTRDRLLLEALADYRRWQVMEPWDARAAAIIATVFMGLGAYDEAATAYHDIADRWPDQTFWALIDMGRAYRLKGDYDKALAALDELVERAGPQAGMAYHYHRGRTLIALGRLDEAVTEFDLGVDGQPDYAYVYTQRACARARLGRLSEALDDQRRGLDLIKEDAAMRPDEAGTQQDLDRATAVLADLGRQVAADPATPTDTACGGYFEGVDIRRARSPLLTPELFKAGGVPSIPVA
jgi:tetratricopeptide (TPR) repeat protein